MLSQLFLVGGGARIEAAPLAREFPSLRLRPSLPPPDVACVEPQAFFRRQDGWAAERALAASIARTGALAVDVAVAGFEGALALCTRLQRLLDRRNRASRSPRFDALLSRHRSLHDLGKPLVEADWHHALDAWQWLLRLDGDADLPLQAAVLFHDIERLRSEAERRHEQAAPDYDAFKAAHARAGAAMARAALADLLRPDELDRMARLIEVHERPDGDRALGLVNDADGLSFFSLNASGFLDYFGPGHTARKLAWTLGRLSPGARARLGHIGFRPDVRALLDGVLRPRDPKEAGQA